MNSHKIGRNDDCPCGSGKKFKKCCLDLQGRAEPSSGLPNVGAQSLAASAIEDAEGDILEYDALLAPDPDRWLALDEPERIDAVMDYHRRARIRVPRAEVHAIFHAVVESQIADAELPVRATVERLMAEGLDRHEAVHAVGSVLAGHMHDLIRAADANPDIRSGEDPNVSYFAELKALTAERWLRSG